LKGAGEHFVQTIHAVNLHAPFGALARNFDEIRNFVQAISAQDPRVPLAAEHDDGRAIAERAVHGSESIHRPWPHVNGRHTWLARAAGITVGHRHRAKLMKGKNVAEVRRVQKGVCDGNKRGAAGPENRIDLAPAEDFQKGFRSAPLPSWWLKLFFFACLHASHFRSFSLSCLK
jgi:hypothetical protein